jgi:hypothetical protein
MDLLVLSELLAAISKLPAAVQSLIVVLIFVLLVIVLVSKKACDNLIRVIDALRGDRPLKKH